MPFPSDLDTSFEFVERKVENEGKHVIAFRVLIN
jgi:hypothetical protein